MSNAFAGSTGYPPPTTGMDWDAFNQRQQPPAQDDLYGPRPCGHTEIQENCSKDDCQALRRAASLRVEPLDVDVAAEARRKLAREAGERKAEEIADEGRSLVAKSFADIEFKRTDWLWTSRIPLGEITMIVGRGSVGKSTMLAHIAAQITNGTLPGDFQMQPRDVLYVANEDDPNRTVGPRLHAAGADLSRVHLVTLNVEGSIDLMRDTQRIADLAREKNAVCIMFDPLSSNLGSAKKNDQGQMRNVFQAIQRMATENNIAVIGLGHTRKGQSKDLTEALMGSSEQANVCRSVIGIASDDEEDGKFIMSQEKSNLASKAISSYQYTMAEVSIQIADDMFVSTNRIAEMTETSKRVSDIIENDNTNGASGQARSFLITFLEQHGATAKSDVVAEGKKNGITSIRTLERAAQPLVHVERQGRVAYWSLKPGVV